MNARTGIAGPVAQGEGQHPQGVEMAIPDTPPVGKCVPAGLLTGASWPGASLPGYMIQWHRWRGLGTYSCGGSSLWRALGGLGIPY